MLSFVILIIILLSVWLCPQKLQYRSRLTVNLFLSIKCQFLRSFQQFQTEIGVLSGQGLVKKKYRFPFHLNKETNLVKFGIRYNDR